MDMLSEDDLNLGEMTDEELARAWDLWFDLAQATNESDPPHTHGVFVGAELGTAAASRSLRAPGRSCTATLPAARSSTRTRRSG